MLLAPGSKPEPVDPRLLELKRMVLATVISPHSKRNYAKALEDLFRFAAGRPLTRALLMDWRAGMETLAASTINVRLSAMRKLVTEARRNGMLGAEEAASLTDVPNIVQKGTRLGNWLTRDQAKALLAVPDRSTLKGKRDYAILALLVGCALRRRELAALTVEDIQLRENRWVIADLCGKGVPIRTVAVPVWVKQGINAWMTAARIEEGWLFRSVKKGGKKIGESLGDWAVWSIVDNRPRKSASSTSVRMTCAVPAPSSVARAEAISSRSSFCWGTPRSKPPNGISGQSRRSKAP